MQQKDKEELLSEDGVVELAEATDTLLQMAHDTDEDSQEP
jgi:hypothetical protein